MAFDNQPPLPLPHGLGQKNGPNEGAPEPTVQPGRGTVGTGRDRRPPQLLNGDNFAMIPVRYHPYSTARRSQVGRTLRPSNWGRIRLPTYRKDFYREHTRNSQRSPEEVEAYRIANEITVKGLGAPKPILHVDEAGLPETITKAIENLNSGHKPTALQAQCWPIALSGRDLVAFDCTASKGKSLAFLVPAVVHAQSQPSVLDDAGPTVIVLTLTREAALQVQVAVQELSKGLEIRTMYLLSGEPKKPQLQLLEEGADICVATPGRLTAFMEEGKANLGRCTFLAIDEADRMLVLGFGEKVRAIADSIRPDRQTLVTLTVGTATQEQQIQRVEHVVVVCEEAEKEGKLVGLLKDILSDESDRAIVFVEMKERVEDLVLTLRSRGCPAVGIHGNKTEQEHQCALDALRSGKAPVLVATDVATRALELDNVRYVVSCDHPIHSSDLLRRFRHAARPDGTGRMYTFLRPDEREHAKELMWFLQENKQPLPPQLREVAAKKATRQ
ncbi:probable ATP-dependent RNA helicase DDX5 [Rhipicephalus sanguineus]|uniref:probable ATP-dependent RNA helicase DDX5 n=1 Tax=Rhipicephalus sanguineus TaxID=34632 RepID=UPI0018957229|nr:probable ATP-dependent RNA helicase DDX5 [Rhipicephalus sanguineus]